MLLKRLLLTIGAVFAILITGGASLMSGNQLSSVINLVLPAEWKLSTPEGVSPSLGSASLPQFTLHYQDCPFIKAEQLDIHWFVPQRISLERAVVDYACLAKFPENSESSSFSMDDLNMLFALLPTGEVQVNSLTWVNLPDDMNPRVKALLDSPSESKLSVNGTQLTISLAQKVLTLSAQLQDWQFTAKAIYQPNESEQHQVQLSTSLAKDLTQLPTTLTADYQWTLPEAVAGASLKQGKAKLNWHRANDELIGVLEGEFGSSHNRATFPFKVVDHTFSITQSQAAWEIADGIILNANLSGEMSLNSWTLADLYPIQTNFSLDVAQDGQGEGRISLKAEDGEIDRDYLSLPLQMSGQSQHGNFAIKSDVAIDVSGEWQDIKVNFLPESLIEVTGKERFLTIKELKFPLGGVRVDKYGINGRLQASFKGESPDFKNIDLNLDGFATNFKAGSPFFEKVADDDTDKWQWLFWGNTQLHALKSKLLIAGSGHWHHDLVELSEFRGNLEQVKQGGVFIPKSELVLTKAVKFDYLHDNLSGAMKLHSPKMQFEYGGELDKPRAEVNFSGPVEQLNFKGILQANELGPVKFSAKRHLKADSSDLIGELIWPEQPATYFQSLLPAQQNWVITDGTIKGDTQFIANINKGLVASGNVTIRNGDLSLKESEFKGIEFSLPYKYDDKGFDLSYQKPLDLKIAEVNVGIPLTDIKVKVQGRLPALEKAPLRLRELSLNLLGGSLDVDQFTLPQKQVAYLNLHNIRFEDILDLTQYRQVELRGRANATLPFWLDGDPCYICDGRIEQAGTSYLKFTPELMKAIKKAGYTEQLLAYTVNDSKVNSLTARVHLEEDGNMFLDAKLRSQLVKNDKTKLNLNYTHKENMFELWQLINYGSQIEQNIEHSIYQKLDK